jgi:hypothetical protein
MREERTVTAWDWLFYYFTPVAWQDVAWFVFGATVAATASCIVIAWPLERNGRRDHIRAEQLDLKLCELLMTINIERTMWLTRLQAALNETVASNRRALEAESRNWKREMADMYARWQDVRRPGTVVSYAAPECLPGCDDDHHESQCPNTNIGSVPRTVCGAYAEEFPPGCRKPTGHEGNCGGGKPRTEEVKP